MSTDYNPADPVWHVLTVSRGGTVSLLKNLDEATARNTTRSLQTPGNENPWTQDALERRARFILAQETGDATKMAASDSSIVTLHHASAGDLIRVECFGPEGRRLDAWPMPPDWESRLAGAVAALRREKVT